MPFKSAIAEGLPVDYDELADMLDDPIAQAQELDCVFMDDSNELLSYDLIAAATSPDASAVAVPELYAPGSGRDLRLGIDFGRTNDPTVCWCLERVGDVFYTREVLVLRDTATPAQEEILRHRIRAARRVCFDYTGPGIGMGDHLVQEFGKWNPGGLMTMLTAPGAGTNTATGSAHQDAFDDLAAAEAEEIAAVLNEKLFAPVLEQWHPGQPHLVEFVMKRPDSDNAAGSVANIATLAQNGYRTPDEQVAELIGLQVSTDTQSMQQPGMVMPPALNSLRVRYAPTMLYPPARAAFERAINMAAQPAEEQPLTGGELAALAPLEAGQLSPEGISSRAATAYAVLRKAVRPAYADDVAQSEGEEETA